MINSDTETNVVSTRQWIRGNNILYVLHEATLFFLIIILLAFNRPSQTYDSSIRQVEFYLALQYLLLFCIQQITRQYVLKKVFEEHRDDMATQMV